MRGIRFLSLLLMIVGSLNWGLIGFFGYDFVSDIFGGMMSVGARIVFAVVGIAGLFGIGLFCRCCRSDKCCHGNSCGPDGKCGSDCQDKKDEGQK